MVKDVIVRLTVGSLLILGIKMSALYFLLMVLLVNTHHRELFGW